jgi:predicted lipoprotein with Yx(FWY)xxD motif
MTTDARSMVTYKGSPLYHFKGDQAAGDTKGNGVGGVWSVVVP